MSPCRSAIAGRLAASRPLLVATVLIGIMLVLISAVRFQAPELLGQSKMLTDFDAFYIAGRLAGLGRAADSYHSVTMVAAESQISGTQSFMPWTYPPPFTLMMQGLAVLPTGIAYAVFALGSFGFYLWVLRRIAGRWLPGVVIAIGPVLFLDLRTGQNGFLIAGLIGAFLLALRDRRPGAGVFLGLLVIKPHLAIGVGLLTLLHRRWSVLVTAGTVALFLSALATFFYGLAIWSDFRTALGEAGSFLAAGVYLLFRMSSIYAAAYSLGAGPVGSMILQAISAMVALAVLARACVAGIPFHRLAALACAASLFVSPYGYDYDLTILGVAVAFVIPDILARYSTSEFLSSLALTWLVVGYGMGWSVTSDIQGVMDAGPNRPDHGIAPIGLGLALLCWLTYRLLQRQRPLEENPSL